MQIKAPNKSYTGESFGVMFQHGIGKTDDPWLISRFKEKASSLKKSLRKSIQLIWKSKLPNWKLKTKH